MIGLIDYKCLESDSRDYGWDHTNGSVITPTSLHGKRYTVGRGPLQSNWVEVDHYMFNLIPLQEYIE